MSRAVRVLVVVNAAGSGPGRLLDQLPALGVEPVVVDAPAGAKVPSSPAGVDGVVLLGGGLMPDAGAEAPWLVAERALAVAAVRDAVPLLGICLGGQLLAHVAGGTVVADSGRVERGSVRVRLVTGADRDPVFGRLPPSFPVVQNHRDEITALPPGAVHLAASGLCPHQAFRVGACAWGLQFHPEVGAERLRRWSPEAVAADGFDLSALQAAADAVEEESAAASWALVAGFAAVVRSDVATG